MTIFEKYLIETESTNAALKEVITNSAPVEGFALRAGFQSKGKGQAGAIWESQANRNILVSILLRPTWLPIAEQANLNYAVALAVKQTVESFVEPAGVLVKWPNDIYAFGKKLAGILIENGIGRGNCLEYSIAGIGLNVLQTRFETPKADSIINLSPDPITLQKVLELLYKNIESWYDILRSAAGRKQLKEYYENSLVGKEDYLNYCENSSGRLFSALVRGVDEYGRLRLHEQSGSENLWQPKQVSLLSEL